MPAFAAGHDAVRRLGRPIAEVASAKRQQT